MIPGHLRAGLILGLIAASQAPLDARAVPSFALQTGQPCSTCHIGAYGPQLTAFGRAFKIGGYTQTGGQGWQASFPVSAFLFTSYTNTDKGQGAPASEHYGSNGNFAEDQIAVFLGVHAGDIAGGLIQGTFNGIHSTLNLDNTDLRASLPFTVHDAELRLGVDVNNGPTIQDPFAGSYAWGYPYYGSKLAPTPAAQPVLAGALAGNSIGTTFYAWYDQSLYLEAGVYNTFGPSLLSITGNAYGPGSTHSPAPYARAAYEWNWSDKSAYLGAIFLDTDFNPATGSFSSDGTQGRNRYTDIAIDGGAQYLGDGTNVLSAVAIFDHERQKLAYLFNTGAATTAGNTLDQLRVNASYYLRQTYGVTAAWQKSWGTRNPLLYAPAPLSGSAGGRPDSNAYILEADWVPFGKADSWAKPWANLKLGAQYTIYTQFNGGTNNYDGFGRNAGDNNTLYLFAWLFF